MLLVKKKSYFYIANILLLRHFWVSADFLEGLACFDEKKRKQSP